jgi:hypothetical protein
MRVGALSAIAVAVLLGACATLTPAPIQPSPRTPPSWTSLSRFSSEADLLDYIRAVRKSGEIATREDLSKQIAPECPPEFFPCEPLPSPDSDIIVTARRASESVQSAPISITNVQNAGVDEGDIVKLYDRFLIVLQDGRLFSVDTGQANGQIALVDRVDVYRSEDANTWYDEILISGNRVVVTGYNYGENATEFSVFSISRAGRFTREAVYFLSSDDYYDNENYATRLVNGNLVIYTPLALMQVENNTLPTPLVRRWLREGEERAVASAGRPLFDARDIYRPIQPTREPYVHTISVCPLGSARSGDELDCRSTAIVATRYREFYVSNDDVYLWTSPGYDDVGVPECAGRDAFESGAHSALFQIPLSGGPPRAQFMRGVPYDQLSMDAATGKFRALSVWANANCPYEDADGARLPLPLRYVHTSLADFSATPRPIAESNYTLLPSVGAALENRFTDNYLIYGGRDQWSSYAPSPNDDTIRTSRIVAVPLATPAAPTLLDAPHNILRIERVGDNAIATGYRDWRGLSVSSIQLGAAPRIAATVVLAERYETEGRSHAFNSIVYADGAGLMGVPTMMRRAESGRWWWRSRSSDVSFLSIDAAGALTSVGPLRSTAAQDPSYACEVSCIDWYGNSRALFIGDRVFALSGTELVEGAVTGAGIADRARLNLTAPLSR